MTYPYFKAGDLIAFADDDPQRTWFNKKTLRRIGSITRNPLPGQTNFLVSFGDPMQVGEFCPYLAYDRLCELAQLGEVDSYDTVAEYEQALRASAEQEMIALQERVQRLESQLLQVKR